jgi:hypothetical protein
MIAGATSSGVGVAVVAVADGHSVSTSSLGLQENHQFIIHALSAGA